MVKVVKLFEFEAAHFLRNYNGVCKNLHGHSYKLEIGIERHDEWEDMIIDFVKLKQIVSEEIICKFDHKIINTTMDQNPTCENMVLFIVMVIENRIEQINSMEGIKLVLSHVKLWETSNSYCEWRINESV
jgi:6-pyruvoyltetrahydropterin/6-carboxytetrahydropterin synthase